jgi:hypothetical protein
MYTITKSGFWQVIGFNKHNHLQFKLASSHSLPALMIEYEKTLARYRKAGMHDLMLGSFVRIRVWNVHAGFMNDLPYIKEGT